MKLFAIIFAIFIPFNILQSRVLEIGNGKAFSSLLSASNVAQSGDTLMLFGSGESGIYIENLKGKINQHIVITSGNVDNYLFDGGNTAIQFSDIEYVTLQKLSFKNQKANGLNIDDGGDYSTPTHNIIIENCHWLGMDASGNNDELKMSGVDSFIIRNCKFSNGSIGGSMIDMVGCHDGVIETSKFSDGGSNCIQAKGGCNDIVIRRNEFVRGGQRSLNIGGSTGMEFFRPSDSKFEAERIIIHSNIFWGGVTPVGFVGSNDCIMTNNTIINPDKWCIRILQENNNSQLGKCGYNSVSNNIFYFANIASNPAINIGSNTLPETFEFFNNLWYNFQNPSYDSPNVPVAEEGRITGKDPMFGSLIDSNLRLSNNSPCIGNGIGVLNDLKDYYGELFTEPHSIGAINGNPNTDIASEIKSRIYLFPNPAYDYVRIQSDNFLIKSIIILDLSGNVISEFDNVNNHTFDMSLQNISNGIYFVNNVFQDNLSQIIPIIIRK